jgi:hypothetical protein
MSIPRLGGLRLLRELRLGLPGASELTAGLRLLELSLGAPPSWLPKGGWKPALPAAKVLLDDGISRAELFLKCTYIPEPLG